MSLSTVLQTIENDAKVIWGEVEGDAEAGALALWNLAKPIFGAVEASAANDLKAFITTVLQKPGNIGADLATLETAVLNDIMGSEPALIDAAKSIGSNLLQVLIGLVLHSL
jgi:hypothetical protein